MAGLLTESIMENLQNSLLSSDPRMSNIRLGMIEKLGPLTGKRQVAPTMGEVMGAAASGVRQGEKDFLQAELATTDYMTNDMGDIIKLDKIKGTTEIIHEGKKIKYKERKVPFRKDGEQWERYETSEDGGDTWTVESEYKRFTDKGPLSQTGRVVDDYKKDKITKQQMESELLNISGIKDPALVSTLKWIAKEKFGDSETSFSDAIDLYFSSKDKSFKEFKSDMISDAMKSTVGIDWSGVEGQTEFARLNENIDYMAKKIYFNPKPVPPTKDELVDKGYYEITVDGKNKVLQWNATTTKFEEINVRK